MSPGYALMRILVVLFFCLLSLCCEAVPHNGLLVLLLDGFRWDYIDDQSNNLLTFQHFKSNGSYVKRVQPVFPADCFPNIYSLFTGLYPSSHGVIGNRVFDIGKKQSFDHHNRSNNDHDISMWLDSEPIWITAKKQNKRVFMYNMPTCSSNLADFSPSHCVPYSKERRHFKDLKISIRQALNVLQMEAANIAVVYDDQMDFLTHKYGPNSYILRTEFLPQLDNLLGEIIEELNSDPKNSVHVMVLSDHGMSQLSTRRSIDLDRIFQRYYVDYMINNGATVYIWPKPEFYQHVVKSIVTYNEPNLILYEKDKIPPTWNIREHKRMSPILLVAKPGYFLQSNKLQYPHYDNIPMDGFHGYPPDSIDMHTPLLFYGPKSTRGVTVESVSIVDLYQVMCHVTDIEPASHNGTWSNVAPLLRHSSSSSDTEKVANNALKYRPVSESRQLDASSGGLFLDLSLIGAFVVICSVHSLLIS